VDNDKIYNSKKELLKFLGIKDNLLYTNFSSKYKERTIPKKNGGIRVIKPPNFGLKKIQRKILDEILCNYPQLDCVYGLIKNKSIVDNAKTHRKNAKFQLLTLDLEDFFSSVSSKNVMKIFKRLGFNKENSSILTKLCTIDKSLPQGAPTSPYLASMVCLKLDKEIYSYCKRNKFTYTRYFDDISISGKNILEKHIKKIEQIIAGHGFICNKEKQDFFDFNSEKVINKILITTTGLTVSENYKKEIKEIYKKLLIDNSIQNQRVFQGKLGFYLHVNRKEANEFFNKIKV
jgi:RNA-directed DNA polymerase